MWFIWLIQLGFLIPTSRCPLLACWSRKAPSSKQPVRNRWSLVRQWCTTWWKLLSSGRMYPHLTWKERHSTLVQTSPYFSLSRLHARLVLILPIIAQLLLSLATIGSTTRAPRLDWTPKHVLCTCSSKVWTSLVASASVPYLTNTLLLLFSLSCTSCSFSRKIPRAYFIIWATGYSWLTFSLSPRALKITKCKKATYYIQTFQGDSTSPSSITAAEVEAAFKWPTTYSFFSLSGAAFSKRST